jgi:ketosteroid isomerase-like protein
MTTTPSTKNTPNPVDRLLDAVAAGTGIPTDIYDAAAVLDATVPHWRLEQHGPRHIAGQLSAWYADPGTFTELRRVPLPDGELVHFELSWQEQGRPMLAHQAHVITVADGRIVRQEVFCGGRWDAATQVEIQQNLEAARGAAVR